MISKDKMMKAECVYEHNGNDTLLYSASFIGAFTRRAACFGEGGADDAFRFGEQPENFDMISEDVCADRCSCLQLVCIYFIDCLLVFIIF